MKRKTVVLLSSVLAGALLVGGTFAAFAVTDLASPKGVDFTPGTQEEVDYVTLDWGDHTDLKSVDEIQLNTFYKSGVLGLYSSKAYDGLLKITIADATPSTVQKDPSDPKLIDYFDVYVYEGKDADPQSAELLGKIDNPQDETQTELKLYLGGTTQGHDVTVYVRIDSALGEEGFAKVHNDVVHLEADWSKNDQSGDYDYTDRTIYVEKPAGWESINAYSWEGDKEGPAWPGKAMNVELPTGLYKTTVPAQDTNLIFNDGENKLPAPTELDPDPSYTYAGYDQNKGYIFWDGDAWQMLPVQTVDSKFSLEINDQEVPAATLAGYVVTDAIVNQGNNIVYDIPVAANDKLEFAYDGDLIYFGGTNDLGQDTLIDTEHTFEEAGTYRFYINRYNHIFYEAKGQPVLSDYYLIGSFNSWAKDDTNYQLSVNQQQEGEYMGVFSLTAGDLVKVYGSDVYYPEGEGTHYTVQATGEHTIYFRPAGNPEWANNYFYVVEPAAPVVGYSATLNGQALDLSDKTATYDSEKDNAAYQLELAKTDVLVFKYGEDVLDFCHWDEEQQKVIVDSQEYTPEEAGTYKFVINKSNEIFVEQEETPVADNIVYGSKAGAAWGKIADLVANGEGEVKALNVELAAGDKFVFHLEGDSWMKYSNLKTEGEGSAHAHFTTDVEDNLIVVTGGAFDFYVLKEGEKTIWSVLSSGEDPQPVVGYTATLNGQALDLSDKAQTFDPLKNNAVYLLDLAANDVLAFKNGETDLHFYHWDEEQQKAIDEGATFTVETAGQYDIYINTNNEIYVGAHVTPSTDGAYHLVGIEDWKYENGVPTTKIDDTHYQATGVVLAAGNTVKATDGTTWLGVATPYDNCGYTVDKDGNAVIVTAGTYTVDVYINGTDGNCLVFTKTA